MSRVILLGLISAITLLCQSEYDKAWSILNKSLADKSADTRANVVHAVGLIEHDSKAQSAAEKLLADTDPKVRAAAARALGKMGSKASIAKLQSAAVDKDSEVVFAAAGALHKLGDPSAYRIYYAALYGTKKIGREPR